jgi:hypothetical protein
MFLTSRMRKQGYNASSVDYHSPIRIGLSLMSLRLWKTPLERLSVVMTNPSIGRSLLRIGRERINPGFQRKGFKPSQYKNPKRCSVWSSEQKYAPTKFSISEWE